MTMILSSSYHHSDSDSISTITLESSRFLERKHFKQPNIIPEQRFVKTSSMNSVKRLSNEEKENEIISLRSTVERLLDALNEKEKEVFDMKELHVAEILDMQEVHTNALQEKDSEMLEMQEVHEMKMLDMLKTKLSNTFASTSPSASCHCQGKSSSSQGNNISYSASYQREASKASEIANAKANKMSWLKSSQK